MRSSIIVALVAGSSALAAPSLSIVLSGSPTVIDVDNFKAVATLTNTGSETLNLLNDARSLLAPEWPTNLFHIQSAEGVVPEFKGVAVKWALNTAVANKHWTTIPPGQAVEFAHSLGGVYNFTSGGPSSYTVTLNAQSEIFQHFDLETGSVISFTAGFSALYTAELAGKTTPTAYTGQKARSVKRDHPFYGCSPSGQAQLITAAGYAQIYADNAYNYLNGIYASIPLRYLTWFGNYSASNWDTVRSHYSKIRNGQLATVSFDCSTCTDPDLYAYTYPDQFGTIYLCSVYWKAPSFGTDSQAGTLVHESSHFTINGGTNDSAYGQADCMQLAISNPSNAILNADSHQYFAENNPAVDS